MDHPLLRRKAPDEEHLVGDRGLARRDELRDVDPGVMDLDLLRRAPGLAELSREEFGDTEDLVGHREGAMPTTHLGLRARGHGDVHPEVAHHEWDPEGACEMSRGDRP